MQEKICTVCGETKPLDEYGPKKNGKFGRNSRCRECHREKCRDSTRKFRERNPDYDKNLREQYRATDEGKLARSRGHYIEACKRQGLEPVVYPFTAEQFYAVNRRDVCNACGTTEGLFEFDHILPISMGGFHRLQNLQILCAGCNGSKSSNLLHRAGAQQMTVIAIPSKVTA